MAIEETKYNFSFAVIRKKNDFVDKPNVFVKSSLIIFIAYTHAKEKP